MSSRLPGHRPRWAGGWWLVVGLAGVAMLVGLAPRPKALVGWSAELMPRRLDEAALRARFVAEHPGEKPLNWAIGAAAMRLRRERPMGKFVLGLTPGKYGNDCSDFVACAVDDALGAQARFRRDSTDHIYGESWRLFENRDWRPGVMVIPGDAVAVRHSPWYPPNPDACWHVGVMGTDGQVYDFTKLRSWRGPRYGRQSFERFVRHSGGEGEVVLSRLRPEYRYRARPLPELPASAASRATTAPAAR